MCAYCHVPNVGTHRCSRCHAQFYCGRDCQLADWRNHKADCKMLTKKDSPQDACVRPVVLPEAPLGTHITAACGTWLTKSSLRLLGLFMAALYPRRDPLVAVVVVDVKCVTAAAPWHFRITDAGVADDAEMEMEGVRDIVVERRRLRGGACGIIVVRLWFAEPIPGVETRRKWFVIDLAVSPEVRDVHMRAVVPPGMQIDKSRSQVVAECIKSIHKDKTTVSE